MWKLFHKGPIRGQTHPNGDPYVPSMKIRNFLSRRQQISDFKDWFGFQFVRDPFDRAISAYFDKVKEGNRLTGRRTNLTSFFRLLVSRKVSNDPHFLPQIEVCDPCRLNISFYGRTETLTTDMDYIINDATDMHQKLNYRSDIKVERGLVNQKTNETRLRHMNLDPTTFYEFLWAFRHDFLAYGYSPREAIRKAKNILTNFQFIENTN